ncbi:hypothetical protein ACFL6X_06020 [Candidatus Latescibacterota bacterium]
MEEIYQHSRTLRTEIGRWLQQSTLMDGPCANHGGEDEANYSLTFFPHYLLTGDVAVLERFRSLLADLQTWVRTDCLHGYEPEAEAHHGTEPFLLFLPRYCGLCPDDDEAAGLVEDAAHHIGNWVDEIPDWYDYDRDCFLSYHIGTRTVGDDPQFQYELAEHFRFIHIALAAHRILGDGPYLEWALRYGRRRAERILASGDGALPMLWDLEGKGLGWGELTTREQDRIAANSHHLDGDPLAGIENLLASGAVQALGDLYALSPDELFRDAARRIVHPLVPELLDPFNDPGAVALGHYRQAFGDTSLDDEMRQVLEGAPNESEAEWAMVLPEKHARREPGVGKRNDMIYWGEWSDDGSVRPLLEPPTASLALGYQLTGDLAWARRALKGAARKFTMARRVLRGGREHADMGGAICSVAAGHGRNWGAGVVTGCYGPLLLGAWDAFGSVSPAIEFGDSGSGAGLPESLVSLVRQPDPKSIEVIMYNGGQTPETVEWRLSGRRHGAPPGRGEEGHWVTTSLAAAESKTYHAEDTGEMRDDG